jgi:hypothetical protein
MDNVYNGQEHHDFGMILHGFGLDDTETNHG